MQEDNHIFAYEFSDLFADMPGKCDPCVRLLIRTDLEDEDELQDMERQLTEEQREREGLPAKMEF
jgi:hypothetical protein